MLIRHSLLAGGIAALLIAAQFPAAAQNSPSCEEPYKRYQSAITPKAWAAGLTPASGCRGRQTRQCGDEAWPYPAKISGSPPPGGDATTPRIALRALGTVAQKSY